MSKQFRAPIAKIPLAKPRHFRFAAEELCASALGIQAIGEYDAWANAQQDKEQGAILQPDVFERIMAFTAMLTVPPYRGREWARREAKESLGYDKTNQSGQKAAVQPEDTGDGATNL